MKMIKKLRSRRGASLLLAMVFMLICAFVGGSVLAGATANTKHLETLAKDQQTYLTQRSTVSLATELLDPGARRIQMIVKKTANYDQMYVHEGNTWVKSGDPVAQPDSVEIEVRSLAGNKPYNPLQRLVIECAILRYADKSGFPASQISIKNFFTEAGYIYSTNEFWLKDVEGSVSFNDPVSGSASTANVTCSGNGALPAEGGSGDPDDLFSFYLYFGNEEGNSHSRLRMAASCSPASTTGQRDERPTNVQDMSKPVYGSTFQTWSFNVTWSAPVVTKGGTTK